MANGSYFEIVDDNKIKYNHMHDMQISWTYFIPTIVNYALFLWKVPVM